MPTAVLYTLQYLTVKYNTSYTCKKKRKNWRRRRKRGKRMKRRRR